MQIALIADIHANALALDAVLAEIERRSVDQIVCLGDIAATGPQPREALRRVRALACPAVLGNADAALLAPQPVPGTDPAARRYAEIDNWCHAQLEPADLDFLRTLQPLVELPQAEQVSVVCFHGSPRSYDDIVLATTPAAELDHLLAGSHA